MLNLYFQKLKSSKSGRKWRSHFCRRRFGSWTSERRTTRIVATSPTPSLDRKWKGPSPAPCPGQQTGPAGRDRPQRTDTHSRAEKPPGTDLPVARSAHLCTHRGRSGRGPVVVIIKTEKEEKEKKKDKIQFIRKQTWTFFFHLNSLNHLFWRRNFAGKTLIIFNEVT